MQRDSYDYIVVGAGSAGAALAAGLADDGRHSVLLLEAGNDDRWIWTRIPAGVYYLLRSPRGLWRFFTEPEPGMNGRRIFWPRGRILGGSSTVNGMIWVHGDSAEYDNWRDTFGAVGWGGDDLKPVLKAIETSRPGTAAHRGKSGPVHVSEYGPRLPMMDAFLDACESAGIPRTDDYNASYDGAGYLQFNTRRGWRFGTREAYLQRARLRGKLDLQTDALVHRVLFDGTRATGVAVEQRGQLHTIACTREVILCAGAIQSPQLLELSGIGDAARLQRLGIDVVVDRPAVGENLHDHLHTRLSFRCSGVTTLNQIMPSLLRKGIMAARWVLAGNGLMSCSGQIIHALVRSEAGLAQPDLKVQLHWLSSPDARDPDKLVLDDFPGVSIGVFPLRPTSRGAVHIQSSDPREFPVMQANYLATDQDRAITLAGVRLVRRIATQPALQHYCLTEERPGDAAQSDDEILEFVRQSSQTSYHPVGSCRMGADDAAVVDPNLRVKGVTGLRVADASVFPTMPSANTNAPAIAVGAKAVSLILQS